MSVDDIAAQGGEPLFFLDYISVGALVPDEIDELVAGVADGCRQARCALLGGEMSEHPGVMEPGEFDLVGFAVGVVERARVLPARRARRRSHRRHREPRPALQRLLPRARRAARPRGRARSTIRRGRARTTRSPTELLRPSVIYAPAMRRSSRARCRCTRSRTSPAAGSPATSCVCSPTGATRVVTRGVWDEPRIFAEIQQAGSVPDAEMEHVFNLGLGMLAVVPADAALHAVDVVRGAGHDAWLVGEIVDGHGRVHVERQRARR